MGSNLALSPHSSPTAQLALVRGGQRATSAGIPERRTVSTEAVLLGCTLALLQIADGILTGLGMSEFGSSMEGNILLRGLMMTIGCFPALFLVKGGSIALIAYLCRQTDHIRWLKPALYGVVGLYMCFAIIPWTYILLEQYLA